VLDVLHVRQRLAANRYEGNSPPIVLPCGASFSTNRHEDAWNHYDACGKCETLHRKRGFYSIDLQEMRKKGQKKPRAGRPLAAYPRGTSPGRSGSSSAWHGPALP
jgi:hypothetical protein